jgi:SAM-dependent methyltransferase
MSDDNDTSQAIRRLWDRMTPNHLRTWYDTQAFKDGTSSLDSVQLAEVGSVRGKRLLHLQCNVGIDTLSWAREGAEATGVDFSPNAVATARSLTAEVGIDARFICCDIYELVDHLGGEFDVVYTSQGVLCWLRDLPAWAAIINRYLKPGGFFYIMEEHPFAATLNEDSPEPRLAAPYFGTPEPRRFQAEGAEAWFEWQWSLADVVNSLIGAGLRIEFLNEFDHTFWQRLSFLEPLDDDWWTIPEHSLPLMFTLKATKPKP